MGFLIPLIPAAISAVGSMFAGGTAAATAMTVGSTIAGAAGSLLEGHAQSQMYNYRAQVAQNNATMADQNAEQSLIVGSQEESRQRTKTGQLIGAQKAASAASGLDVAVGSSPFARDATQAEGDLDALTLRFNAARQAYGFQVEGQSDRSEAKMDKLAGRNARLKSYLGAASSIIGGVSKLSGMGSPGISASYGGDPSAKVIV